MLKKVFSAIYFLFFVQSLFSEKIKLVISGNISGNLYSCQCGLKKSVGLLKRNTYLKENNLTSSILLDIGSSLDGVYDYKKANLTYKTFVKMGYTAIGIGSSDIQLNNFSNLQSAEFPFISTNLVSQNFFSNRNLSQTKIKLKTRENEILIVSHLSESEYYLLKPEIFKKLKLLSFKDSISGIDLQKPIILLHRGNLEEAFQIKKNYPEILVITGSTESNLVKGKSSSRDNLEVFHLGDKLGDKLLILEIEIIQKRIKVLNSNLVEMNYKKLKDDVEILEFFRVNNFSIPD